MVEVVKPLTLQPGDTFVCSTVSGNAYVKLVKLDGTEADLTAPTRSSTGAGSMFAEEFTPLTFLVAANMAARMHGFVVNHVGYTTDRSTGHTLLTGVVMRDE